MRRRRAEAEVAGERDHRAGAGADAVDRRDDRLRAVPHCLDEIARHAREREELGHVIFVSGPMISCTSPPEQKLPPAPVTTTTATSLA